jgi:gluconate 2-dehydrogenase gamma chain
MNQRNELLGRREALRRVAFLLGGAVSGPTLAGVLAGCERPREQTEWRPQVLTEVQGEMVATMGEIILPETDTPGARAARVHEFIDVMLTDYYTAEARWRFLTGLERVDVHSRRAFGRRFLEAAPEQQLQLVQALNRQAFSDPPTLPERLEERPVLRDITVETGRSTLEEQAPLPLDPDRHPEDVGEEAFFRTLKELVLVGYYTSEPGANQELRLNPMGPWRADVPYAEVGQAWST